MNVMPFNFLDIEAIDGLPLYPPGDYILEILKVEERPKHADKPPRLLMKNSIVIGPWASEEHVGCVLHTSCPLTPVGAKFLKRLFTACGFTEEVLEQLNGKLDPEWLIGKRYVASLFRHGDQNIVAAERPLEAVKSNTKPEKEADIRPIKKTTTESKEDIKVSQKRKTQQEIKTLHQSIKKFVSRLIAASKQFLKVLREG